MTSTVYEILGDEKARAAYDSLVSIRKAKQERVSGLDDRRRKLREDLEMREKEAEKIKLSKAAAAAAVSSFGTPNSFSHDGEDGSNSDKRARYDESHFADALQKEVERLRKEGFKLLQKQQELMKMEMEEQKKHVKVIEHVLEQDEAEINEITVIAKWKAGEVNSEYYKTHINSLMSQCGHIMHVVVSAKKGNSALVVFDSITAAAKAIAGAKNMKKQFENPLQITWSTAEPPTHGDILVVSVSNFHFQLDADFDLSATRSVPLDEPEEPPVPIPEIVKSGCMRGTASASKGGCPFFSGLPKNKPAGSTPASASAAASACPVMSASASASSSTSSASVSSCPVMSHAASKDAAATPSTTTPSTATATLTANGATDYETLTLLRMKQAQERKKQLAQRPQEEETQSA